VRPRARRRRRTGRWLRRRPRKRRREEGGRRVTARPPAAAPVLHPNLLTRAIPHTARSADPATTASAGSSASAARALWAKGAGSKRRPRGLDDGIAAGARRGAGMKSGRGGGHAGGARSVGARGRNRRAGGWGRGRGGAPDGRGWVGVGRDRGQRGAAAFTLLSPTTMLASGPSSPPPTLTGRVDAARRWLRGEWVDPAKRAANMVRRRRGAVAPRRATCGSRRAPHYICPSSVAAARGGPLCRRRHRRAQLRRRVQRVTRPPRGW